MSIGYSHSFGDRRMQRWVFNFLRITVCGIFFHWFFQWGIIQCSAEDSYVNGNFVKVAVPNAVPSSPDLGVKAYVLMDADSGQIIAGKDIDSKLAPASLTKIMTLYLTACALRDGRIGLSDEVLISEKAWRAEGSRMFVQVGSRVSVEELIRGIVVASGNDATIAMAEHIAGSEEAFVDLMNLKAKELGLEDTIYADSSGSVGNSAYSTAADQAKLVRSWLKDLPSYYSWFNDKWITYNKIKQSNRNRLLWLDSSVDGIKTGHTNEAGYCLVASAKRNQMRLISVVLGAKTDGIRVNQSISILNYGFRFFETHKLFDANVALSKPRVFFGKSNNASLGLEEDLYVTVPSGQYKSVESNIVLDDVPLRAPLSKGKSYGAIRIFLGGSLITSKPILSLVDNMRCNFIFAIFDYIRLFFSK